MRLKFTLLVGGLLLGLAACRGSGPPEPGSSALRVEAIYGSSSAGVRVSRTGDEVLLETAAVPDGGLFLRIDSEPGTTLEPAAGFSNDHLLYVQAAVEQGTEIGLVQIDRTALQHVSIRYRIVGQQPRRMASLFEDPYRVDELVVVPSPQDDYVTLNWVEKNIGDYDFNGEVNAADLVPLSQHIGESGFRNSTAANTTPLYYIDGDENNEINLADIVPIARNYKNSITGYRINKNGEPVLDMDTGQPAFYSRDPQNDYVINAAPVFFQVNVQGSFEDQYGVLPVDAQGSTQSESVVFDGLELQARMYISPDLAADGLSFFDLNGNGAILVPGASEETYSGNYCVMRVIDPIDIVNGLDDPADWSDPAQWESVPGTIDAGIREGAHGYRFEKLRRPDMPTGHPLPYQLEFLVAPTVDLVTGQPRSYGGQTVPNSFYYRFAVPVYIPAGHHTVQADLSLDLVPAETGPGYDVVIHSHQYQTGDEFDDSMTLLSLAADENSGECLGSVRRLFNPDDHRYTGSDFQYSPAFPDANCDGISDPLQLRLITLADAEHYDREPFPLKLRGTPLQYDDQTGRLELKGITQILPSGLEVFYAGQRTMNLSELSQLHWIIHEDSGDTPVELDPGFLTGLGNNASILLDVSLFDGSRLLQTGLEPLYWANSVTITLDLTNAN